MRKILVSSCLYGDHCRYDAVDRPCLDPRFLKWKEEGRLVKVCPEVFGGLPTPRPDSQRQGNRVVACNGKDVTGEYEKGAREAVRLAREQDVLFCVMKQHSPSCGSKEIYDGTFTDTLVKGEGRAVQLLREAGFRIFAEEDMDEASEFLDKWGKEV